MSQLRQQHCEIRASGGAGPNDVDQLIDSKSRNAAS
jgi:hypothetical protein